jgi:hypothetical protein
MSVTAAAVAAKGDSADRISRERCGCIALRSVPANELFT